MDALDLRILHHLKQNARANANAIGAEINLSTSSVIERIRRLERTGVIRQYTIVLDHETVGKDIVAFTSVNLEHPKHNDLFREMIRQNNQIAECHYLAGDYDYILKIITESSKSLEEVLNYIKAIRGVLRTRTLVVLSTIKSEVSLLPDPPEE